MDFLCCLRASFSSFIAFEAVIAALVVQHQIDVIAQIVVPIEKISRSVEDLLCWAYGEELPKAPPSSSQRNWHLIKEYGARGGIDVGHSSAARYTHYEEPHPDARRILGENAVDCYGLDRAKLEKIAERIGPEASDMLGGAQRVKPEVVADFHRRSDFNQPPEQVDPTHIRDFFRPEDHMVMV